MKKYLILLIGLVGFFPLISFAAVVTILSQSDGGTAVNGGALNYSTSTSVAFTQTGTFSTSTGQIVASVPNDAFYIQVLLNDGGANNFGTATIQSSTLIGGMVPTGTPQVLNFTWGGNGVVPNLTTIWTITVATTGANSSTFYGSSGSGAPAVAVCYGGTCGTNNLFSPAVNFKFPANGTTTPIFDNYWLTFTGLNPTDLYSVNVSSTEQNLFGYQPKNSISGGYGQSLMHQGRLATFQGDLTCGNSFSSSWNFLATAVLSDLTSGQYNIAQSTTNFYQLPVCGTNGTSTFLSIFPIVNTSSPSALSSGTFNTSALFTNPFISLNVNVSSTFCQKPAGITDIGGGIVYAGCILFTPTQGAIQYLTNGVAAFQQVPPFSFVFAALNRANAVIGAASGTGTDLILSNYAFDSGLNTASITTPLALLTSSTLSSWLGTTSKNSIFQVEDFVMYAFLFFAIVGTIWHWWHKKHNPSKQIHAS